MRLLLTADWHIQRGAWKSRPNIRGDSRAALEHLVNEAIIYKKGTSEDQIIIAAGDLYDVVHPSSDDVIFVHGQLDRLKMANIPILFIQGQHERSFPPWLSAHDWPIYLNETSYEIDGKLIYGLDWQPQSKLSAALGKIPTNTFLFVCHQVWSELLPFSPEGSLEEIPYAPFILTGDRHRHVRLKLKSRKAEVFSPGSFAMQDISEEPFKSVFSFDLNSCVAESVSLPSRPFIMLSIPDDKYPIEDYTDALEEQLSEIEKDAGELPPAIRTPIVRVKIAPEMVDRFSYLRSKVQDRCHLFSDVIVPVLDVSNEDTDAEVLHVGNPALNKSLVDAVDAHSDDKAITDFVVRIVSNQDVSIEEEIKRLEHEVKSSGE